MIDLNTLRAAYHPARRRIVDHLHVHGPSQVGALAAAFELQVGSVSHHLRVLERAGIVERAPEMASDGRESWWKLIVDSLSWSVDDYPAVSDQIAARAAERISIERQLAKLARWKRESGAGDPIWRQAAFSTDHFRSATPDELADLSRRLIAVVREWSDDIDPDDGQQRSPVFVFAHGFPSAP